MQKDQKSKRIKVMCHHYELACDSCIKRNIVCTRRVVMVLCSDCETGNKSAFEKINEELEKGTIDPQLEMLCTLPDCPHVGKSIKAAFSNWWLI